MPRIAHGVVEDGYFHVLNRGNHQQMLFRQPDDFSLFLDLLGQSVAKFAVELWGYCLKGNHWHLVVSVERKEELAGDVLAVFVGAGKVSARIKNTQGDFRSLLNVISESCC